MAEAVYRGVGAHARRRLGIGPAEIRREEYLLPEVAAQPIAAWRPGQVPRERQQAAERGRAERHVGAGGTQEAPQGERVAHQVRELPF